jgi:hypothetical protein
MLILLIVRNEKTAELRFFQWHNVHIKVRESGSNGQKVGMGDMLNGTQHNSEY